MHFLRPDRVDIDHGISGTKRERPGLDQALAAVRTGDTLVVPKLDRLARSVPDARDIGDTLAKRGVSLSLGGQIYDPDDPMGKLFFNILATFAEFEVDLIRMRTREGMAVARAQGKLKGRQPKLSPMQRNSSGCTRPASTRSQISASCSRCCDRWCTARSAEQTHRQAPLTGTGLNRRSSTGRFRSTSDHAVGRSCPRCHSASEVGRRGVVAPRHFRQPSDVQQHTEGSLASSVVD